MFGPIVDFIPFVHLLLGLAYAYLTWNFNYWSKRGLRTAKPLTLFGSFPSIITGKRNFIYDIHDVYLKYKQNNRAIGVLLTRKPEILILDPKLAHEVLVTNFRHYHDTMTSAWVTNREEDKYARLNPFFSAGEEWKKNRTEALAGLTQNKLKLSYPIWESSCQKLRQYLEEKTTDGAANVETRNLSFRFTADVMCDFIWGIDAGTFTDANKAKIIVDTASKWTTHIFMMHNYVFKTTIAPMVRKLWRQRLFNEDTDRFFAKLTNDAVNIRLKQDHNSERPDFLNYLLKLRESKGLTMDECVGHSLTVMLDGYETTAGALMHTLFYLAKYPRVQEKLRSEILTLKHKEAAGITYESLSSLPYLDQCVHETLRIITLIPSFNRICTQTSTIELSSKKTITVPEGMIVTIPVYSFHHDEDYFPEPSVYRPERFDNQAHVELTKQGIFLPFGDGPRICIGMRAGLLSLKSALVEILSRYEINCCAQTPAEQNPNAKTFLLGLEGDIILEYKKL